MPYRNNFCDATASTSLARFRVPVAALIVAAFLVAPVGAGPRCVAAADAISEGESCGDTGSPTSPPTSSSGISLIASGQPVLGVAKRSLVEAIELDEDLEESALLRDDGGHQAFVHPSADEPFFGSSSAEKDSAPTKAPVTETSDNELAYRSVLRQAVLLLLFAGFVGTRHFLQARSPCDGSDAALNKPDVCSSLGQELAQSAGSRQHVGAKEEADDFGCTALHYAADRGAASEVRELLAGGADVSAREAWDETPLHFAARAGSVDSCRLLVEHGAHVNQQNESGDTPLLVAARASKEAACKFLLDAGGHVGGVSDSDLPPLLSALFVERLFEDVKRPRPEAQADHSSTEDALPGSEEDF